MFIVDVTVMVLEAVSNVLGTPTRFLEYTINRIKNATEDNKVVMSIFFFVGWIILGVASVVTLGSWAFSRPASPADQSARIAALEQENAALKSSRDAAYRLIVSPSPQASITPVPIGKVELTEADYMETIADSKQEIAEMEAELKAARAKPKEAERTPAEIETELVRYRAELKDVEKELENFRKGNKPKVQ